MRQHAPVTQNEFTLADDETLLSTTDLKGRIAYANDAFVRVSGYSRQELYGKAHNIVRHPDMPPAAFADMWSTLQAGQPWSALVKNRRKNGDYYWVRANACPVQHDGKVIGYLSVRTKPTPEEVRQHHEIYRHLRQPRARWRLRQGWVVCATGWRALLAWTRFIGIGWRLQGSVLLGVMAGMLIGACAALAGTGLPLGWPAGTALLLALLGVAALMALLQRTVVAPIRTIRQQARDVASGLRVPDPLHGRADELGAIMRSVQQSGLNLASLVDDIQGKVAQVRTLADTLCQDSDELSEGSQAASAALAQSSAALQDIATRLQEHSSHTTAVSQEAAACVGEAARSLRTLQQLQQSLEDMGRMHTRIADIVGMLDGVAFQTNLLALNASVEAARAGEQGRGFAVVAAEVRKLSQQSAAWAADIRQLIGHSHIQMDTCHTSCAQALDSFSKVGDAVHSLDDHLNQMQASQHAQACAVEEICSAVAQLQQGVQGNTRMAADVNRCSQRLQEQATRLDEAATVFQHARAA